jgi:hypothetical protein
LASCTKETTYTLTYPTTFTYNVPSLESRSIFKIDSTQVINPSTQMKEPNYTVKLLTSDLGSFNWPNGVLADTLNDIIRTNFQASMISKITLLSATQMKIEYSKLVIDTSSALKDYYVPYNTQIIDYQQIGNNLSDDLYINNDSREIYLCQEFIFAKKKLEDNTILSQYYQKPCKHSTPEASILSFVSEENSIKYDTASVEIVNFIFSSFK